ncbi:MAG: phosphoribosylglycinamide formyltransferase [Gammaproteobacteria bacterium]|jgi:phosphoribosylglycinamide formyltransferase-1|tara:strand:+ start:995 stop:1642 length:648 start_codon:yes stop_codon:yes gene_type:complete
MKKIVVLISGGGSNLEAIAKACQIGNIPASVELVISNQTDVKGLERAKKFHLMSKVIEHQKYNSREEFDQALLEQILPIEPDLVVLAGFMRILSKDFTDALSGKLINIHPSLLPNYPGLNTHKQAIENGDLMHGISVHYVNNELDGGPIITQGALKIDPSQSERKLINRIHKIEHMIYPKVIADIAKGYISLQGDQVKFESESHFGPNHMEFFNV